MGTIAGLDMVWWQLLCGIVIAILGGLVRGLTGFGGALVMTLPLALVLGPQRAVLTVLLLETLAALSMMRAAFELASMRVVAPIALASWLTVPLGGYLLLSADPLLLRRLMAAVVIVFSVLLLKGVRYQGRPRLATSLAVGAASGMLVGSTSMGGPPAIIYLLSGPDTARVNRANLNLCVGAMSLSAVVVLAVGGIMSVDGALGALFLAPCFYAGLVLGVRLFPRLDEQRFRRFTLLLLATASGVSLLF